MMTSGTHWSQTGSLTREGESLSSAVDRPMSRSRPPKLLDQADGWGRVLLPDAIDRKYPNAPKEWRW